MILKWVIQVSVWMVAVSYGFICTGVLITDHKWVQALSTASVTMALFVYPFAEELQKKLQGDKG
jgi:hypothetical protein